jgi:hypothetical protein
VKGTHYKAPHYVFFHPVDPSCLLLLNILLGTLFSDILKIYYSPNVRDQISGLYKTESKIIVLYALIIPVTCITHPVGLILLDFITLQVQIFLSARFETLAVEADVDAHN